MLNLKLLEHLSFSPDLVRSDYHGIHYLKEDFKECKFSIQEEVIEAMEKSILNNKIL